MLLFAARKSPHSDNSDRRRSSKDDLLRRRGLFGEGVRNMRSDCANYCQELAYWPHATVLDQMQRHKTPDKGGRSSIQDAYWIYNSRERAISTSTNN